MTGVSVASIKYYLREGLVPAGTATAPNQAQYADLHAHRVRLVRALREVGGLSIEAIRAVVQAIEDSARPLHEVLGVAHRAIAPAPPDDELPELTEIDDLLRELGWEVSADAPARRELAAALASLRAIGRDVDVGTFLPYAAAVEPVARREIASLPADLTEEEAVEHAVVGSVVYGAALAALRRLAQEHHSARRHEEAAG